MEYEFIFKEANGWDSYVRSREMYNIHFSNIYLTHWITSINGQDTSLMAQVEIKLLLTLMGKG